MEARGGINSYQCEDCRDVVFTVNLHTGVTPFISRCTKCGGAAQSGFYRVKMDRGLRVTEAWYRPRVLPGIKPLQQDERIPAFPDGPLPDEDEFEQPNPGLLDHFLNAGLTRAPLAEAIAKSAGAEDTIEGEVDQEEWAKVAKVLWGVDLKTDEMGRLKRTEE